MTAGFPGLGVSMGRLFAGVWFNGRTSAFQADDVGSIPVTRSMLAHIAQLVEHFLGREEVIGSTPIVGSS